MAIQRQWYLFPALSDFSCGLFFSHEARFAGVFMFFANICAGVALEVMLLLLDHFGYDGNKQMGETEPGPVVTTIRVGYGTTLLMMLVMIIPAMVCYPITRQKHAVRYGASLFIYCCCLITCSC